MEHLEIEVNDGECEFQTFIQKKRTFTPRSTVKRPKVQGSVLIMNGHTAVITLGALHLASKRGVYIGNVHLQWMGEVDEDGIPGRVATAKYGVNIHVERPSANKNCSDSDRLEPTRRRGLFSEDSGHGRRRVH